MRCGFYGGLVVALAVACATPPRTLGATALLRVVDADLAFQARVDTGAASSSLHATDLRIDGDQVHFVLEGEQGERVRLVRPLHDVALVRNAQGEEQRPRVLLRLALGDFEKVVPVSLRDRSAMAYRLLVGRDFLEGDFVVDVSREVPAPR